MIYVASSWKNVDMLDEAHAALRAEGFKTWDFRENGFWWKDVHPDFLRNPWAFVTAPQSMDAFEYDRRGLDACDGGLVILPAGISTEERFDIMWLFVRALLDPKGFTIADAAKTLRLAVGR